MKKIIVEQRMMKAAVLAGPRQIEIKEEPIPELKSSEIEMKVSFCGVGGSYIHI